MRPKMTNKNARVDYLVFVLPKALELIKNCLSCPNEKNVRDLIEEAGRNNIFKSLFLSIEKKISCVAVPRNAISKDVLQTIDHCKGPFTHRKIFFGQENFYRLELISCA